MMTEPTVPVDDTSLALIEDALNASLELDNDGEPVVIGAAFSMNRLLEFWSGDVRHDRLPVLLHRDDIIRALIGEIRRIR